MSYLTVNSNCGVLNKGILQTMCNNRRIKIRLNYPIISRRKESILFTPQILHRVSKCRLYRLKANAKKSNQDGNHGCI